MKNNFRLKDIKTYTVSELYNFRARAMLSQGNGHLFSQILENRIDKIGAELEKRGEILN
jgi:hypothetical protein